ncbi:MAG: hypothetical protein QXG00_04550 [Candidatus Woesearchaeota archaeon]
MSINFRAISKISLKKLKLLILGFSISYLVIGTLVTKSFFDNEIIIYDPRYIQLAHNLFYKNTVEIRWGTEENRDSIMINPYNIQKGIYKNWFPIGYSLVIYSMMLISENYLNLLILFQLILFSFIPLLVFNIGLIYWKNSQNRIILSFIASLITLINPYYAVSPLWQTDTWLLVLLNISFIYVLLKIYYYSYFKYFPILIIICLLIFLIRPLISYSCLIFSIIILLFNKNIALKLKTSVLLVSLLTIMAFGGLKNYLQLKVFDIGTSNAGYNLWLSNNEYTNEYLKKHLGDGGMIEDVIIPKFDKDWAFLSNYSEYEKDKFFKEKVLRFIAENPIETLENSLLKFLGFFSPFRIRSGHWSDSSLKNYLTLLYQLPLNIIFFFSLFYHIFSSKKNNEISSIFLIYILSFVLPYLVFFSMTRFKAPIEFLFIILSVNFIYNSFTIKKIIV